jgi:protocatechuate 3,4-dioxygenase beta subunit
MRKATTLLALTLLLLFAGLSAGQSSNASVTGFVQDASGAFVPGATVTATNTQTGVTATTISNESGSYTIPALLPGTYKLTATLPGFSDAYD